MEHWFEWAEDLKKKPLDLRVETFVSEIVGIKRMGSELFYLPNGGFKRAYSKDIAKLTPPKGNKMQLSQGIVELNRRGVYDNLPEGIFHQPLKNKPFKTLEELKSLIKNNKEKEDEARRFFWPLDHTFTAIKTHIEDNERKLISETLSPQNEFGLKAFWNLPKFLNTDIQGKMLLILPLAHKIAGNLPWIAETFRILFKLPFEIKKVVCTQQSQTIEGRTLGGCALGVDSILGEQIESTAYGLEIAVGPLTKKTAATFSKGKTNARILDFLCDHFIPAGLDYRLEVLVLEADKRTLLDEKVSALGVTTYLN